MEVFDPPILLERGDPNHKLKAELPWLPAYRVQYHYVDYSYAELSRFYTKEFFDKNGVTPGVIAMLKKNYPEGGPSARLASVLWAVEAKVGNDHYWTVAIYHGAHLRKLPISYTELPRGITICTFIREGDLWKQTWDRDLWFLNLPMDSAESLKRAFEAHEVRVYFEIKSEHLVFDEALSRRCP